MVVVSRVVLWVMHDCCAVALVTNYHQIYIETREVPMTRFVDSYVSFWLLNPGNRGYLCFLQPVLLLCSTMWVVVFSYFEKSLH